MRAPGHQQYLGSWLLLVLLCSGACTGVREAPETPPHYFDKTEVDLEYGRPEAASRYHTPRGVQHYTSDKTDTDLATPLATPPEQEDRRNPPAAPGVPSQAPLPGGDR
jgi:hypothetical protein